MKVWILCLIVAFSIGILIIKCEMRRASFASAEGFKSSAQIDRDLKILYESGKCGKVAFIPGIGHRITWHLYRSQPETLNFVIESNEFSRGSKSRFQAASGIPGQRAEVCFSEEKTAVTYGLSGGRLGDHLLSYLHARWIAYRDHVPLVFKPFPMAEEFALSQQVQHSADTAVMEIPYFPEPSMKNRDQPFLVDWDDPGFREEIVRCLAPIKPHSVLELPPDRIHICVHVRRGGTFDPPSLYKEYPLKFPPDSYYVEQIRRLVHLFRGKPLFIFLMTDDLHPEALVERYRRSIRSANIEWSCRKHPPEDPLDDFFSIPKFDCLILSDSNFSIVASKLTEYAVRIAPTHYVKKKGRIHISGVEIAFNPAFKQPIRPPPVCVR